MQSNELDYLLLASFEESKAGSATVRPNKAATSFRTIGDMTLRMRIPLAFVRLCSYGNSLPDHYRVIIDVLGRILDPTNDRDKSIDAVNKWNEAVLSDTYFELDISQAPLVRLSDHEHCLIDALMRLESGCLRIDDECLSHFMEEEVRLKFCDAGQRLLDSPMMSQAERANTTSTLPSVLACEHLNLTELLVVNMARLWVRSTMQGFDGAAAVRLLGAYLALPQLSELVCAVIRRTAKSAYRKFDIRCICCQEISPDEALLLDAFAGAGLYGPSHYEVRLKQWLSAAWAQVLSQDTSTMAEALQINVLQLPSRDWDFKTLAARQPLFNQSIQEHCSVH